MVLVLSLGFISVSSFADNTTLNVNSVSNTHKQSRELSTDVHIDEMGSSILADNIGVKIKLLQLKRKVNIRVENSEKLIEEFKKLNKSLDYDKLNLIVENFKKLNIELSEINLNRSSEELAVDFISTKNKIIELSKQFKELIDNNLTETELLMLRKQNNERIKLNLKKTNLKLEKLKTDYNLKQINLYMNKLGLKDQDLIDKFKLGKIDLKQVKFELKQNYLALNQSQRKIRIKQLRDNKLQLKQKYLKKFSSNEFQKKLELKNKYFRTNLKNDISKLDLKNPKIQKIINEHRAKVLAQIKSGNITMAEVKQKLKEFGVNATINESLIIGGNN